MLDRMLLADVLDEALKKGGSSPKYTEEKVSTSVSEEDRIEKDQQRPGKGAGIRVLVEG